MNPHFTQYAHWCVIVEKKVLHTVYKVYAVYSTASTVLKSPCQWVSHPSIYIHSYKEKAEFMLNKSRPYTKGHMPKLSDKWSKVRRIFSPEKQQIRRKCGETQVCQFCSRGCTYVLHSFIYQFLTSKWIWNFHLN